MRKKKEEIGIKPNKKNNKYIKSKNYNSIMKIHEEKSTEFSKENINKNVKGFDETIKKNLETIETIKKELAIKKINNIRYYSTADDQLISKLLDKNKEIEIEKKYLESGEAAIQYTLNTCNLLNSYLELEEKEKYILNNEKEQEDIEQQLYEINHLKNNITDEYMKMVDPNYVSRRNLYNIQDSLCDNCNIVLDVSQGYASCYQCGSSKQCLQQALELSYKEQQEMDYRPQFTYEKMTHLEDWIRRFSAKEHKEIPQSVLDTVILEAQKERVKNLNDLTEEKVKKYLKKRELNEYYDNVISIINRINKRPPFVLTQEIETKIKTMFQQIQAPFEKYKTNKRKNMLSYSYLLHKFFQILDLPEFSKYFFLLKSPEKLRQQDEIFKKIVEELSQTDSKTNWRFFPSI